MLASFAALASTAHAQAPIAAYSFNEGAGTIAVDATGNNNTLSLMRGPAWVSGRYSQALSFDALDDFAVATSANSALNLTGRSLTLSAWIYPRSNSGWQMIVNKPFTTTHSPPFFDWSLHRENSTGRIVAFFGCEVAQRTSNASTPLNTWTHVAVTYDGSSLRHYINGVLDRTTSVSCAITNTNSRPIRVGANAAGSEVMNGSIDDVRIYNRVLSVNEIQNDMSTPLGGASTPADTAPPSVSIASPTSGAAVGGSINVAANASDNVGVVGVQFQVDGTNLGAEDLSAPYSVAWNTAQVTNGSHTLTAIARDAAGNKRTSAGVSVSVYNGGGTPSLWLGASPSTVSSGQTATLSWNSSNVTSCNASGAWSGSKPTNGSQNLGPLSATQSYSLTCSGPGGTTSRSTTVTVTQSTAAPTLSLSATPTSVPSGGSSTLSWSSSNASSCTASGAWSGSKPTSGSASTGTLTNPTNDFTLTCSGVGGSIAKTARVTVQSSGGGTIHGLDFPGSAATENTIRFRFRSPLAIYPATYIWRVKPRHQLGYYTTFFWANDGTFNWGGVYGADTYYGAHPYPTGGGSTTSTHRWEIAALARDYVSNESVVYDVWYTQALRVWADSSGKHHEFYWDLPNTSRVIRVDLPPEYGNIYPPNPALTFGDAPWAPSKEIMNGIIRGIQIYSATLSVNDILAEVSSPRSTSAGTSNIWYLNLNPTPTDISDKSGAGHHPEWVGTERPRLWTGD